MVSLVCLNTYMGKAARKEQLEYLASLRDTTDIYCFQEVTYASNERIQEYPGPMKGQANWFREIAKVLPDHTGYFTPACHLTVDNGLFSGDRIGYGIAVFVKKNVRLIERRHRFVYKQYKLLTTNDLPLPRPAELLVFECNNTVYNLIHLHGLWDHHGRGKIDLRERIWQSLGIRELYGKPKRDVKLILMGDLNLDPKLSPYSLGLIQTMGGGLIDLIKTRAVMSTRSSLYPRNKPSRFADYAFVTPNIVVHEFSVPQQPVISDHCPLLLKCY